MTGARSPENGQVLRRRWKGRRVGSCAISTMILLLVLAAALTVAAAALVALLLLHLHGRLFLELVHTHRQKADDVLVDAHLPLHLRHRRVRRLDVHQRVVRLAVLVDAEREALQAPVLGLADRAAGAGDDALELLDKLIDALARRVLAGQE